MGWIDQFKNYFYLIGLYATKKNSTQKMQIWMYNECVILISRHKITLDKLALKSIKQSSQHPLYVCMYVCIYVYILQIKCTGQDTLLVWKTIALPKIHFTMYGNMVSVLNTNQINTRKTTSRIISSQWKLIYWVMKSHHWEELRRERHLKQDMLPLSRSVKIINGWSNN